MKKRHHPPYQCPVNALTRRSYTFSIDYENGCHLGRDPQWTRSELVQGLSDLGQASTRSVLVQSSARDCQTSARPELVQLAPSELAEVLSENGQCRTRSGSGQSSVMDFRTLARPGSTAEPVRARPRSAGLSHDLTRSGPGLRSHWRRHRCQTCTDTTDTYQSYIRIIRLRQSY